MTTTTSLHRNPDTGARAIPTDVEIVVPVYNEERGLEDSVHTLVRYLEHDFPFTWHVVVADNASTDGTWAIAHRLAAELTGVDAVHLDRKGRGRALRTVWLSSRARVVSYMDVDLSTGLDALPALVAPLLSGHSDVAIGSRLSRSSRVERGTRREFISRSYNLLLRTLLGARFSDAQCGFKAVRTDVARELLPLVQDGEWFFDTELLVLAEHAQLRIHEVPVDWVDDPDSRVDVRATAAADLAGMRRLAVGLWRHRIPLDGVRRRYGHGTRRNGWFDEIVRFVVIGVLSTLAYALLYLLLRPGLGAQGANFAALLITAVANTAANRRVTFGVRGPRHWWRHQGQGLVVFALGLALTSGSLALLHALAPGVGRGVELAVLVVANLAATVLRFVLLRGWVFAHRLAGEPAPPVATPAPAISRTTRKASR